MSSENLCCLALVALQLHALIKQGGELAHHTDVTGTNVCGASAIRHLDRCERKSIPGFTSVR